MNGQITIQSAIDELQRNFKILNERYFNSELERPVKSTAIYNFFTGFYYVDDVYGILPPVE